MPKDPFVAPLIIEKVSGGGGYGKEMYIKKKRQALLITRTRAVAAPTY